MFRDAHLAANSILAPYRHNAAACPAGIVLGLDVLKYLYLYLSFGEKASISAGATPQ